MELDSST